MLRTARYIKYILWQRRTLYAQGSWYVRHAGISSFLAPGAGQFMTGETGAGALLPGMGVAAGTWVLSMVNRTRAARSAVRGAQANLADGTVSSGPVVGPGSLGGGLRVRFH